MTFWDILHPSACSAATLVAKRPFSRSPAHVGRQSLVPDSSSERCAPVPHLKSNYYCYYSCSSDLIDFLPFRCFCICLLSRPVQSSSSFVACNLTRHAVLQSHVKIQQIYYLSILISISLACLCASSPSSVPPSLRPSYLSQSG